MKSFILIGIILFFNSCNAQENNRNSRLMKKANQTNPLLCDTVSGLCETGQEKSKEYSIVKESGSKAIKLIYFTDPICSACWGVEPQLRKLILEYGTNLESFTRQFYSFWDFLY